MRPSLNFVRHHLNPQEKCAAVLFASAESVVAAVAAAAAAPAGKIPWKNWDVQPMTSTAHASREYAGNKKPNVGATAGQNHRESTPFETHTDKRKPVLPTTHGVVALAKGSSPRASTASQDFTEDPVGLKYITGGGEDNICKQELSPLSSLEGLEIVTTALEREGGGYGTSKKTNVEGISGALPCGGSTHGEGGSGNTSHPGTFPRRRKTASGIEDEASQLLSTDEAVAPLVIRKRHDPATRRQQPNRPPLPEEDKYTDALHGDQACMVAQKGGGVIGRSSDDTGAPEEHTKARDQAKRLALEVARLRSALRVTTSELNTERSTRVRIEVRIHLHQLTDYAKLFRSRKRSRLPLAQTVPLEPSVAPSLSLPILVKVPNNSCPRRRHQKAYVKILPQDEWWKKMREWEEDRDSLITSKQEAERASRSVEEKMARHMAEVRAPPLMPDWITEQPLLHVGSRCRYNTALLARKHARHRIYSITRDSPHSSFNTPLTVLSSRKEANGTATPFLISVVISEIQKTTLAFCRTGIARRRTRLSASPGKPPRTWRKM